MTAEQQFYEQVTRIGMWREIERIIDLAQTQPISPEDAALLRVATGIKQETKK